MPRTPEQVLRDYLGDQVLTLAKLTAENEALRAQIAKMQQAAEVRDVFKPNGRERVTVGSSYGSDSI